MELLISADTQTMYRHQYCTFDELKHVLAIATEDNLGLVMTAKSRPAFEEARATIEQARNNVLRNSNAASAVASLVDHRNVSNGPDAIEPQLNQAKKIIAKKQSVSPSWQDLATEARLQKDQNSLKRI